MEPIADVCLLPEILGLATFNGSTAKPVDMEMDASQDAETEWNLQRFIGLLLICRIDGQWRRMFRGLVGKKRTVHISYGG